MADITGGPLLNEAREVRAKLALTDGNERLLAKLDALLARPFLHGGEQITLRNHIEAAKSCLPN